MSSVDVQFVVVTESMAITAAMRKSANWASTGIAAILGAPPLSYLDAPRARAPSPERAPAGMPVADSASELSVGAAAPPTREARDYAHLAASPEAALILNFGAIRRELVGKTAATLDGSIVLKPFLEVIKSTLVSGHITALALSAVEKFLVLGVVSPQTRDAGKCINELVTALARCRFAAGDRSSDDAVMLQLLLLMDKVVAGPCGALLSAKSVARGVDTCMRMLLQMRRGDAMRRTTLNTLLDLVQTVFAHYGEGEFSTAAHATLDVLVRALDPEDMQTTNTMRLTALEVLKTCFEAGASRFAEAEELAPVLDALWRNLAQLVRTTNFPLLVRESLLMVATIMSTAPKQFKNEFAFVLLYVLTSLTPLADLPRDDDSSDMFYVGVPNRAQSVKSAPVEPGSNVLTVPTAALHKSPETREAMVEALATWAAAYPCLYADLFVNYDCDKGSFDLCEDLVGFLCRNAYPDSATWSTASVPPLCLEAVLSGLSALVDSLDAGLDADADADIATLLAERETKAVETRVAETFNNSTSKGVAAMVETGLIPSADPEHVAQFLKRCKKINKAVLGKYFAKSENKDVLAHYVNMYDFRGLRIDEALRLLLCSFRLPGESQQIENLLQKFADRYIAAGDKVEDSSDAAFILAYAVLMLNTDHYSPTLKRRMDYDAFLRNVKGVNKSLPDEYVREIFDGITTQEIIMPEEHDTDETFAHSWRELVLASKPSEPYRRNVRRADVARAVFDTCWTPLVSTLSFVFATATDDLVFRRVITGFHQLAQLATAFGNQKALSHVVACLSHISALASGDLAFLNTNIEVRIENEASIIVSDLSTQFGADLKAQMASITLFSIVRLGAQVIAPSAHGLVAKAFANLYVYGLSAPECVGVAPVPCLHTFERPKSGKSVGILSALSSYLTSSPNTPDEPSDESVDVSIAAAECVRACDVPAVLEELAENASRGFSLGVLEVLPAQSGPKFGPAQNYLLHLLALCAGENLDIRKIAADKALELQFNAVALALAPKDYGLDVLARLANIDAETVKEVTKLPPSPEVWDALSTVESAGEDVCDYIVENHEAVDAVSAPRVLAVLERVSPAASNTGVVALELLARQFRHEAEVYLLVLSVLGEFSGHPDAKIRENALSVLQTELLQDDQEIAWADAVQKVLMPHVLEVILRPEVWKRDPKNMEMTRQQVASLIGKVFLHLSISLNKSETDEDTDAWIAVLKTLDRLLSSRRQPALEESVVEMLKNVILVTRLSSKGTERFWAGTDKVLRGFLPEVAEMLAEPEADEPDANEDAHPSPDVPLETYDSEARSETIESADATGAEDMGAAVPLSTEPEPAPVSPSDEPALGVESRDVESADEHAKAVETES